jgi:phosphate transporter
MKFGKRMLEEMIEEWRQHYFNYKRLKELISTSTSEGDAFEDDLVRTIREELIRADSFCRKLFNEVQATYETVVCSPLLRDSQGGGDSVSTSNNNSLANLASAAPSMFPKRRTPHTKDAAGGVTFVEMREQSQGVAAESTDRDRSSSGQPSESTPLTRKKSMGLITMVIAGGKQAQKLEDQHARKAFVEWYSTAARLVQFCELNLEAVRKSLKKAKKVRGRKEDDFTAAVEAEMNMSQLASILPKVLELMETAKVHFAQRFDEPLEQYGLVQMASKEVWHAKWRFVALAAALFLLVLSLPLFVDYVPAHKCLALFVLVITMWVTEAIPFFCTAMLIPLVAVPLGILQDPVTGGVADPVASARIMLGKTFDHVQILVLGGLTIAKAMSKTNLELEATMILHRHTAHDPDMYLLSLMVLSCVMCSVVSNVAAPLLVLGVIQRTLWQFPPESTAPQAILLALAVACNLGGMLSPISSPQNAVALQVISIPFAKWVSIAFPVVAVTLVFAWFLIRKIWKPFELIKSIPLQVSNVSEAKRATRKDVIVVASVSTITVVLWCLPPGLLFGDTGIIALIPIVVFFGIGILKKEDFNTLPWHLMFLLAGGNMLGACAHDSRMLDLVARGMRDTLTSQPAYVTIVSIIAMVAIITTFVSHTVASMILLPVIAKIGAFLPTAATAPPSAFSWTVSPEGLVFLSVLMCSGAMAFPISSFPNVNSLLAEDASGVPYLTAKNFLSVGSIVTLFFFTSLITWMVPFTAYMLQVTQQ